MSRMLSPGQVEEQLQQFIDNLPELAWSARPDGHIDYYNQRWYDYTGTTLAEMEGWNWRSVHDPEMVERVVAEWTRSLTTGEPFEMEFPLRGKDGRFRWFLTRVRPLRDGEGKIIRWFGTNTDVDELRRLRRAAEDTIGSLQSLRRIGNALAAELDEQRLTQILTDEVTSICGAQVGAYYHGSDRPGGEGSAPRSISGVAKKAFLAPGSSMRSLLSVPVREHSGTVLGTLVLGHAEPKHFTEAHQQLVALIAVQAAIALDNARFYRDARRAEEQERRRARQAAMAADVGLALTTVGDLGISLTMCCAAAVERMGAAFARVWTLSPGGTQLELQASAGLYSHIDGPHRMVPVGQLKIGLIASERRPYLTNDLQNDARLGDPEWARREGMVAFAGYPLIVEERLVGVLALFARAPLDPDTLSTLAAVANQIAVGIDRRRVELEVSAASRAAELERTRLRMLFEQVPAAIATLRGPNHVFDTANARYLALAGNRPLLGKTLREAFPELEGQGLYELFDRTYLTAEPYQGSERPISLERDGRLEQQFFNIVYQPLIDANGVPYGVMVFAADVSEQIETRQVIRASELRYRFLTDAIPVQVWTANPGGALDFVNRQVTEYFDQTIEQVLGAGWQGSLHPDDLQSCIERWTHSITTGEPYETEFRLRRADASYRWHVARALALKDEQGRILEWFGTNSDIQDRKLAEEDRERLIQALERSNQDLDQFAYVVSHDLKAPLRGIANLSVWIEEDLEGRMTPEATGHLTLLRGRIQRLEALIDGILTYARAGRVQAKPERVDTERLVADVVDILCPPRGVQVHIAPGMPTLETDAVLLQQVFLNLISNACKHARSDGIRIEIGVRPTEAAFEFTVRDNGPGIAPQYHERIWGIFQTLQPRDKVESTGIGLSVVKKIVEGRGGRVWVESSEGAGASFGFSWPLTFEPTT